MKKVILAVLILTGICANNGYTAIENEGYRFGFEKDVEGWEIPDWALENEDYAGRSVGTSVDKYSEGKSSLSLNVDFPGNVWRAAIVECPVELDLRGFKSISMDVYLPKKAATNLVQGRIVVAAGPLWFLESKDVVALKPGKWVTVKANLDINENGQLSYWKCKDKQGCLLTHLDDVKKISLRLEYNANASQAGKAYSGPVYVDNVVIR